MLKINRAQLTNALWASLTGFLLSAGLLVPLTRAFAQEGLTGALTACVVMAVISVGIGLPGPIRWVSLLAGALALLVPLLTGGGLFRVGGAIGAAVHLMRGNAEPLRVYAREVGLLCGALLTLLCCQLAHQSAGFYPALSLTMITLLMLWFTGKRDELYLLAPALVALAVLFARAANDKTPYPRTLLISALAVGAGLLLTPVSGQSPALEEFAETVRTYISDTLFFNDPRNVYSIEYDGYKPLAPRLGGPVNPQPSAVMKVETPKTVLLRGTVYNAYNGLAWGDTLSTRRFLYADPRYQGTKADLFDENLPSAQLKSSGVFDTFEVKITMHKDSASTLFLPLRTTKLTTPMALVPYFNASTEIFITRDLALGDTYSATASVVDPSDPLLPAVLASARQSAPARDMSDYLGVPDQIATEVRTLAERFKTNHPDPLDLALTIRDYLRINFTYTLSPVTPPGNQDFVSFFLLRGKEGYCTYFASAMAVLGRLSGLPTRYVEGYAAIPVDGVANVTADKAHAWCEVYFDGFGWIAFDATPGGAGGNSGGSESPPPQREDPPPNDQDEPDEQPTPSPEPQNNPQQPEQTPQPSEEPQDPASNELPQETEQPQDEPDDKQRSLWWLWLLVLAVIGFMVWRGMMTRPEAVAATRKDEADKLLTWYRALLSLLKAMRLGAYPAESPVQHAARIAQSLPADCGLDAVADAVTRLGYGKHGTDAACVAEAERCYRAVWRAAGLPAKGAWLVRRMLPGAFDVRAVP